MNFTLVLVLVTAVSGLIWAIDAIFFAARRATKIAGSQPVAADSSPVAVPPPLLVDYARSFFPVLFIVLVLRSFVVEPFRIPSGSMLPTLRIGDFILVSKFSYGIKLPVLNKTLVDTGSPDRGDVAVFRFPDNPKIDYIKRVVGLPGDLIGYINRQLVINGEPVSLVPSESEKPAPAGLAEFEEDLDGAVHKIYLRQGLFGIDQQVRVPEGHYFVMGDNRDNSHDSRGWGFVPEKNLVGRAFLIWMNWNCDEACVNFSRIGNSIQ